VSAVGVDEGSLREQVDRVAGTWGAVVDSPNRQNLDAMASHVRRMVQRARDAGYRRISELGSIIEVMLGPVIANESEVTEEFQEIIANYLSALRGLADRLPESTPVEAGASARRLVFLGADGSEIQNLRVQLRSFGYSADSSDSLERLLPILRNRDADVVILDLDSLERFDETLVRELQTAAGHQIPVLAISRTGDLTRRLAAARAGVRAYLLKPIDVHELVDELDRATAAPEPIRFHILLVEDSPTQAAYFTGILERAGMDVSLVSDPMRVLDVLAEHMPDLILMDMYMPGCDGMELARVIRQFPAYASIPIVFLSAETAVDRQLDAMSLGGDDFLTKPINPTHLIRSVTIRAERARSLRSFMVTDNLTGLFNHSRIKEQLKKEVARAVRRDSPTAFAMLDIDGFKAVNDTYGHPMGDRVIKTLARVLQSRLRQSDYIGRYGGEEFAVILPDATAAQAARVLDGVRQNFARIRHFSASGPFQVTFSGGVSDYPTVSDADALAVHADRALYAAKRQGRNRVLDDEAAHSLPQT
jgi:diguanylate cyclase (GGDEF)-like protein